MEGVGQVEFAHLNCNAGYVLIAVTLERVLSPRLGKTDRATVLGFLEKATGLYDTGRPARPVASSDRPDPGPEEETPGTTLTLQPHPRIGND